jgi:hypothetical protein
MLPSEDNIASFLAFAPEADEGKAFMFLEVRSSSYLESFEYTDMSLEGCEHYGRSSQPVL